MKKFSALLLLLALTIPLSAQPGTETSTSSRSHPFGAYSIAATSLNGSAAIIMGGGAGWQLDRSLALGVYGYGLITRVKGEPAPGRANQIALGYAGLDARYIRDGDRPYHLAFSAFLGGGVVSYLERDWWGTSEASAGAELPGALENDFLLLVEPAVDVEANVGEDLRVTLGASYRYISGVNLPGLSNGRLSGLSARVGFRLGMF